MSAAVLPGQSVAVRFTTRNVSTGALVNADALPVGDLLRNGFGAPEVSGSGSDSGGSDVAVTVENVATGRYVASFTVPANYVAGDFLQLEIAATVNSVPDAAPVWEAFVDTKRVSGLQDPTVASIQSGLATLSALGVTTEVARGIRETTDRLGLLIEDVSGSGSPVDARLTADALLNAPNDTADVSSLATSAEVTTVLAAVAAARAVINAVREVTDRYNLMLEDVSGSGSPVDARLTGDALANTPLLAVSDIQSGLATSAAVSSLNTIVTAIQSATDRQLLLLEDVSGSGSPNDARFTADALLNAPAGSSGGSGDAEQATLLLVKDATDRLSLLLEDVSGSGSPNDARFTAAALANAITAEVLKRFVTDSTGESSAAAGSVAKLAQGAAAGLTAANIWEYSSRTLTQTAAAIIASVSATSGTEYITESDMRNRLTVLGYDWVADRDVSGTGVTSEEEALYVIPAIKYAGALVDEAVSHFCEPSHARAAGNQWLKDRCLDIAVARAVTLGGRKMPKTVADDDEFSRDRLEQVREDKIKVPNLTYPRPSKGSGKSTRHIRNRNVK